MIFGYAGVSTKMQARDGNSLEGQIQALKDAGAEEIYQDTFSGTKVDRPEFEKLQMKLRKGDTLIVTKLDRLARSVSQASGLLAELIDQGVTINVLNLGILSSDSVNMLLRKVLLAFAQFERDMIVQRTQEGKAAARATDPNFKEGRPRKWDNEQLDHALDLLQDHSYNQVVKMTGISKSTLIREKNRRKQAAANALFDGIPYDGSIVNMGLKNPDGSVCYIIGVLKTIRKKLNKHDGDRIHVVIEGDEG